MSDTVTTAPTPWDYGMDGYWIDSDLKDDYRGMPVSDGAPDEFTLSNGLTLYKFNDTRYQDIFGELWDLIFWDYPEYYTFVIGVPKDYLSIQVFIPAEVLGNKYPISGYLCGYINTTYNSPVPSGYLGAYDNVYFKWDNELKELRCYYDYWDNDLGAALSGYSVASSSTDPNYSGSGSPPYGTATYPFWLCVRMATSSSPGTYGYTESVDWTSLDGNVEFTWGSSGETVLSGFNVGSPYNLQVIMFTAEEIPVTYSITIKDPTTDKTLGSITLTSDTYKATLTTAGLTRTLTLTNSSEEVQTLQWSNSVPAGKVINAIGNDNTVIKANSEQIVSISLDGDITFYEEYEYLPTSSETLVLYNNEADPRRLDKTNYLRIVGEISGTFRSDTNVVNPVFRFQGDSIDFNYVYISSLHRYYYVTGLTYIGNSLWEVSLQCDVLMTYRDGITSCYAFVDRTEDSAYYNTMIVDSDIPFKQGQTVETHFINNGVFPSGVGQLVLTGFLVAPSEAVSTTELQSLEIDETDESEVETDERTEVAY